MQSSYTVKEEEEASPEAVGTDAVGSSIALSSSINRRTVASTLVYKIVISKIEFS
jgi:hypothetical protein